jgi:hypothetical protein
MYTVSGAAWVNTPTYKLLQLQCTHSPMYIIALINSPQFLALESAVWAGYCTTVLHDEGPLRQETCSSSVN